MKSVKLKSPITYYGGKTSMLPHILPLIPDHYVYTETFFGGGAVFWAKPMVPNETINDLNGFVVNFYTVLKNNFLPLKKQIEATIFSRQLHDRALLIYRNPASFGSVQKAWALWMLSNFSYGNKLGGGVKYSNDRDTLPPQIMQRKKAAFTDMLVARIENTHIECRCATIILKSRNAPEAFHYIDPPYPGADQGHYKGYTIEKFADLLEVCTGLKGKFMLSNYGSDILSEYIERNGWYVNEFTFSNKGMRKNDRTKNEVLVTNYLPVSKPELPFNY